MAVLSMSDKKLRYSVNAANFSSRDVHEEPRSMSPKLTSKISGFFDKLISSNDVKCYICGVTIAGFRPEVHVCKKCGGETCSAHSRDTEISEGNKQLMCARCSELVTLETLRFTSIQQVDKLKQTVKESESANRSLLERGEALRTQVLEMERAISEIEGKTKLEAEQFEVELLAEEERKRKVLEEVYALTADFREMSGMEQQMKEVADALALSCHCQEQDMAHMSAACQELYSQLEDAQKDLHQKVPIFRLKKMLCRECYQKVKAVYRGTDDGRQLFSSVLSVAERPQPLEQFSCYMSCKSAYARLKYL